MTSAIDKAEALLRGTRPIEYSPGFVVVHESALTLLRELIDDVRERDVTAKKTGETIAGLSSALEHRENTIATHEATIVQRNRSVLRLATERDEAIARAEAAESRAAQAEAMVRERDAALPTQEEWEAIEDVFSLYVDDEGADQNGVTVDVWMSRYALAARKARK